MWGEIARLLDIRNHEDFFGKRMGLMVLMTLFFVFLNTQGHRVSIFVHLILLCFISLNANQLVSLFRRKECEFIAVVNARSERNKFWTFCLACIVENFYYLLLLIVQLIVFFNCSLGMSVFISGVHFIFALALGIMTSQIAFMNIGIIALIAYYITSFFMATSWAFDENWRFLSLTLQLNHVKMLNQSNTLSLMALTIVMAMLGKCLFSKYRIRWQSISAVLVAGAIVMGIFINHELDFNRKRTAMDYKALPKQSSNSLVVYYKALDSSQIELMGTAAAELVQGMEKYGANDSHVERIYFDKYYISFVPNLYKTRPIPVALDQEGLKINVFSDAMINCDEPEMFGEMLNRIYDHLERNTPNFDNKYVYQIVVANREFVLMEAYEHMPVNDKKALIGEAARIIDKRKKDEPTQSNYVKKMMIVMHEQYPEKIPALYHAVQEELPESNEAFQALFETHFPELTKNQDLMTLVTFH